METTNHYQEEPLAPQPKGVTTVTDGAAEWTVVSSTPSKRTPQKHRQYWTAMRVAIEQRGMIQTRGGLLRLMDEIEEWVG